MSLTPVGSILGNGLISPLRRLGKSDFVSGFGEDLIRSAIRQILMTNPGEIPWRPSFGAGLDRFRHRGTTLTLQSQIEILLRQSVQHHEPRAEVHKVQISVTGEQLTVEFAWSIVQNGSARNVIAGPFQGSVVI